MGASGYERKREKHERKVERVKEEEEEREIEREKEEERKGG